MKIKRNHEHGQITVLMVFAIIALFGSAALAIDGGMLYIQRRAAQSAADNAAMTGALAIIKGFNSAQIDTIVQERTSLNGFDNSSDDVEVQVFWPPQAPNPYAGNSDFIQVIITSRIPLAFTQIVYSGALEVTVEATSHARVNVDLAPGVAMLAANSNACKTLWFNGNPTVDVSGGGSIASNSDAGCGCDLEGGSGVVEGPVTINVIDGGEISVSGCWGDYSTNEIINPAPIPNAPRQDLGALSKVPTPDCSGLPINGPINTADTLTLQPGIYESLKLRAGANVTLEPGLYCFSGSIGGSGLETLGSSILTGDDIMIYLMESAGGFTFAGGSQIYINASEDLRDASGNQWAGMLMYVHPDNNNVIALADTSNSWYEGSVVALGSHCDLEGTSGGVALQTQLICDTIEVHETGDLDLIYDEGSIYHIPASVDLSQ